MDDWFIIANLEEILKSMIGYISFFTGISAFAGDTI